MLINKPPVLTRQLDRCDVCGNKKQKMHLVRTQVEFLDEAAENYVEQSSYDGTFWVVDSASDEGLISYGNRCDNARLSLANDNTFSYVNGVQTWEGNGTFRQDTDPRNFNPTTDVTFSAQVGPHEQNTSPDMTVTVGVCDTDGNNKQVVATFTINTATRVWFTETFSNLTQDHYYIEVVNDGKWWVDELQLEANTTSGEPCKFVRTSGANVSPYEDRGSITARKVCSDCFEVVLSKSEKYGRQQGSPVEEPIDTVNQEF